MASGDQHQHRTSRTLIDPRAAAEASFFLYRQRPWPPDLGAPSIRRNEWDLHDVERRTALPLWVGPVSPTARQRVTPNAARLALSWRSKRALTVQLSADEHTALTRRPLPPYLPTSHSHAQIQEMRQTW